MKYIINGKRPVKGEINLQGSKNASLPIIAACVLNKSETVLHNVPDIEDVRIMLKILQSLGCRTEFSDNVLCINSDNLKMCEVSENLVNKMRSSIILMGALLAINKQVTFSYPGGCDIGLRPIDLHLKGLRQIGAQIEESHGYIVAKGDELVSASIILDYPSVGATENIMLASVFTKGVTSISNAAREPEILDLQNFLNAMGARVYGAGTNTIYIEGVDKLHSCEYTVMPDRIAAGTFLCANSVAGGELFLRNCKLEHIKSPYYKLLESGMRFKIYSDGIMSITDRNIAPLNTLITSPYPAFPTDLQPPFTAMLCFAKGTSVVNETIFENRYRFVSQLSRMGADIKIEGRIAIITGKSVLSGANVYAHDLRGGAALIVAALGAEGKTIINDVYHIERGYENIVNTLRNIGVDIKESL